MEEDDESGSDDEWSDGSQGFLEESNNEEDWDDKIKITNVRTIRKKKRAQGDPSKWPPNVKIVPSTQSMI